MEGRELRLAEPMRLLLRRSGDEFFNPPDDASLNCEAGDDPQQEQARRNNVFCPIGRGAGNQHTETAKRKTDPHNQSGEQHASVSKPRGQQDSEVKHGDQPGH